MAIRPDYYKNNGLEAFDVIKAFFRDKAMLSHAFKYMARAGKKGDEAEDIRKAITYLQTHLEWLEEEREKQTVSFTFTVRATPETLGIMLGMPPMKPRQGDEGQPVYVTGDKK